MDVLSCSLGSGWSVTRCLRDVVVEELLKSTIRLNNFTNIILAVLARDPILLKVGDSHHLLVLPLAVITVVTLIDHPVAVGVVDV